MAFGLLDGGGGLSAALIATSAVSIFSALMLAAFSAVGLLATVGFRRSVRAA